MNRPKLRWTLAIVRQGEYNEDSFNQLKVKSMDYMTTKDAGGMWNISRRRVEILCQNERIVGAIKIANVWLVPKSTEKPVDHRYKKQNGGTHEKIR